MGSLSDYTKPRGINHVAFTARSRSCRHAVARLCTRGGAGRQGEEEKEGPSHPWRYRVGVRAEGQRNARNKGAPQEKEEGGGRGAPRAGDREEGSLRPEHQGRAE